MRSWFIASDAGGIPDIIHHSENGYLVSKHLLAKFSAAVQEVLDLPKHEKERVRANARRFCVELWDSKKHLTVLETDNQRPIAGTIKGLSDTTQSVSRLRWAR